MKITKRIGSLIFAITLVAMIAGNSIHVFAADPIVIDFSKDDYLMDAIGGNGAMDMVNDGDRRVLYAECIEGYDPANDPDGTATLGDLYAVVSYFEDYGVNADSYKWMKMSVKNESEAPFFEFHFESPTKGYNVETSVNLEINPKSDYTSYVYNISEMCEKYYPKRPADVENPDVYPDHWRGMITALRLDFMYYEESGGHARTGDKIYIEYIAFFDSKEAADAWEFKPARTVASIAEAKAIADAEKAAKEAEAAEAAAAATEAETEPETVADVDVAENNENAGLDENATEDSTSADSNSDDTSKDDNNTMTILMIGGGLAVIVIIVIIVSVTNKKKQA